MLDQRKVEKGKRHHRFSRWGNLRAVAAIPSFHVAYSRITDGLVGFLFTPDHED
jgi:hypothetical protein